MKISANYYSLLPSRFIAGTRGSYGFEKLELEFSPEWDGLSKKIVFSPPSSKPVAVVYAGGSIDIPYEVMSVRGKTRYAVIGYKDEKKLLSVSGEIDVLGTLDDTDTVATTPTADEMAQVLSYMQSALDTAKSVREDADNGVFNGKDGKDGVDGVNGEKGEKGEKGDKGDTGSFEMLGFEVDSDTGMLVLNVTDDLEQMTFSVNDEGCLEVSINE